VTTHQEERDFMNGSARRADRDTSGMPASFSGGEWRMLRAARPNILIIGADEAVSPAVSAIVGVLPGAVARLAPNAPPPHDGVAEMLIMPDIAELTAERQREWLAWLDSVEGRRPQIVATSAVPLYPLVVSELFLEALYYRLNTILLDAQEPGSAAYQRYSDPA
jgi:hypothetical protein